jgi:hypothetical protein
MKPFFLACLKSHLTYPTYTGLYALAGNPVSGARLGTSAQAAGSPLQAFRQIEMHHVLEPEQHAALLDAYTDAVAASLRVYARGARGTAEGNSYGERVRIIARPAV